MSSEKYTVPCKGIIASSQHDWKFENLLTRGPREDEFLVEMIATGVCHTDISGYGGIYPRVLGHEGTFKYPIHFPFIALDFQRCLLLHGQFNPAATCLN